MQGIGTVINVAAIIAGGIFGLLFGRAIKEKARESLYVACGVSVMILGIAGALEKMLTLDAKGKITSTGTMLVVGCICLGTVIGEIIDIESAFERFGEWLKVKSGNAKDVKFVESFVNASFTVCIGAMAIVGSIQDGLMSDPSTLVTKAILDLIIILVMTSSQGVGCIFSAIPVAILQGSVTALSRLISPIMTPIALSDISLVGSVLIFCVGVNLVFGKKVRVANMLPSIVVAVIAAFLV